MTLDPRAIAELERLLAEATPGPWAVKKHIAGPPGMQRIVGLRIVLPDTDPIDWTETDHELVATMRNLLPDLLRERRELLTRVADLHSRIDGDMLALGNDELAEQHEAAAAEWRAKATEGT